MDDNADLLLAAHRRRRVEKVPQHGIRKSHLRQLTCALLQLCHQLLVQLLQVAVLMLNA